MNDHFLVVRFSSLGDVLLTSPVVLNLRLSHPSARITYLTKESLAPLVRGFDGLDEVVTIRDKASLWDYYRALTRLDRARFTTIIDLHGNPRSWLARKVISADRSLVYPKRRPERRAMIRRHGKQLPTSPIHTIDAYNQVLAQLGHSGWADRPVLRLDSTNSAVTTPQSNRPLVAIAPGAAHQPKQYGLDRYVEIAAKLQADRRAHILWLATPREKLTQSMLQQLDPGRLTEVVDRPLPEVASNLASADVAIANDSGIAHLASAVGTPVVVVFGPTHPTLGFAPRGLHDRVVQVDEFCRPCSLHGAKPCYRDEQFCFTRLDPDSVVAEVAELLALRLDQKPALFLDRDGTVIKEKHFLKDPEQVELENGAAVALRDAQAKGYRLVVISNQSGVARGLLTLDEVEAVNGRMLELLAAEHIEVAAVYFCPIHRDGTVAEFTGDSRDRKPGPGMVETAALELNLDLRASAVIGDRASDLHLASVIGCPGMLVRTGYGRDTEPALSSWERARFTVHVSLVEAVATLPRKV